EELHDVVIIAATNRPDIIDTALLRPGRFDRIIMADIPDVSTREKIFEVHTKNMPLKDVDIKELARTTEGYVGADIEAICREAAMIALRENKDTKEVKKEHFKKAIEKVNPSATKDIQAAYSKMIGQFRQATAKEMQEEKPSYLG
ncbi:AAA family ATPase, partial [Candidatus Woesearchaeota archaeon]|nr:AAA family ATPase [Candidatus Woesearchaeota archaeon]